MKTSKIGTKAVGSWRHDFVSFFFLRLSHRTMGSFAWLSLAFKFRSPCGDGQKDVKRQP
jgi:hypothetical protein